MPLKGIRQQPESGGTRFFAYNQRGGLDYPIIEIGATDTAAADAAGRLRVSDPYTVFESKLLGADKQPLFWDERLETGAGITSSTPTAAKPYIDFTSMLNTAGKFTRQTLRRFNHQLGKAQKVVMIGILALSGGGTGVQRRIGYFDDDNGAFVQEANGVLSICVRSNESGTPVDTVIAVEDWNIDALAGAGPSGQVVDLAESQVFILDFQWPAGRVRFGFEVRGVTYYAHEFISTDAGTVPWCSTPNLPVRYQMITTDSSPVSSMRCVASSVVSEGGLEETGVLQSESTPGQVNATSVGVIYALIGIQLRSTHLGCTLDMVDVSILSDANASLEWMIIYNPTVAGTFAYAGKVDSCMEVAVGDAVGNPSANTVAGGLVTSRGFVEGKSATDLTRVRNTLSLGAKVNGDRDQFVLAVRNLGPAAARVLGALTWGERL